MIERGSATAHRSIANDVLRIQFHVKDQGAAKPIQRRRWRQDESLSKKVLDIDGRFIDAYLCDLCVTVIVSTI